MTDPLLEDNLTILTKSLMYLQLEWTPTDENRSLKSVNSSLQDYQGITKNKTKKK